MRFYPKARKERPSKDDPSVRPVRLAVLKAVTINLILLQILFLGLFCYLFGSLFQETDHVHNFNILFVDYDGGPIGAAVRSGYETLQGPSFPSLMERPTSAYPQPGSITSAVCDINYWGALYTTPNASDRLTAALAGGPAASSYNQSNVLVVVWNQARYPTVIDSAVFDTMKALSDAARVAYSLATARQAIQTSLNSSDPAALAAFSDPWTLASVNLQPTSQGSRVIYNTLCIILILIQEFFYLGYVNGVYMQFKLYTTVTPHRIAVVRQIISGVYTFVGSLCTTGAIWAFRSGWDVNAYQFLLCWMALWLFAHLNFVILDVFTIWISPPFVPMALISWIVLNVTSVLLPFELSPGFYKWGYALPAHSVFNVLIDIWSHGCNPQLYYALPVLFVYEVVGVILSSIGVYRRAHYAVLKQEAEEKSCDDRAAAILSEHQQQQQQEEEEEEESSLTQEDTIHEASDIGDSEEIGRETTRPMRRRRATVTALEGQNELADMLRREITRSEMERVTSSRDNTGPSFEVPFVS
ncbi:hypothetical protein FE257_013092 [Aspergillus nanangensis]|uniref:DUF3533 domain-containing protein n=1 Tax=Aspergillus nanangensis TaxID=2582783 RepID=A0AAD4CF01_ASPNN|nr:hypothetical protein FE257_013092 [Aspergillus nanangensis]